MRVYMKKENDYVVDGCSACEPIKNLIRTFMER